MRATIMDAETGGLVCLLEDTPVGIRVVMGAVPDLLRRIQIFDPNTNQNLSYRGPTCLRWLQALPEALAASPFRAELASG